MLWGIAQGFVASVPYRSKTMSKGRDSQFFSWISEGGKDQENALTSFRMKALSQSRHLVGNFFHYRHAIKILGWQHGNVFKDGRLDLDPCHWADFGPLNFHIGPPIQVIKKLKRVVKKEYLQYYPPDLITPLRNMAAEVLFQRKRNENFDVIGTEGAQASMAYTILAFINPGDEVIITDPGYFFLEPPIILSGGVVKRVKIDASSSYRMNIALLHKQVSKRTKMIIVCDPINPFGVVQTKQELKDIIMFAKKRNIIILNNITHGFHALQPQVRHYPMSA